MIGRVLCTPFELGAILLGDKALTAPMTAVPMVVTSIICSKGPFPSLHPHLSSNKMALCRAIHIPQKTSCKMLETSNYIK